jgi:hypothetical protein
MRIGLMKFLFVVMFSCFLASCAGTHLPQSANQGDDHIVRGGSFAGEGMIYFPVVLPNDKK